MANDLMVVKANSLIEASYRLTLDEMRLLALTIGTMDPKSEQQIFEFTVADFVRKFPEVSIDNAYKQIQMAIKRIYDRSVRTEDSERVTEFRWVSSRTYFKKEGRFRIAMTNEVMPYLTQHFPRKRGQNGNLAPLLDLINRRKYNENLRH